MSCSGNTVACCRGCALCRLGTSSSGSTSCSGGCCTSCGCCCACCFLLCGRCGRGTLARTGLARACARLTKQIGKRRGTETWQGEITVASVGMDRGQRAAKLSVMVNRAEQLLQVYEILSIETRFCLCCGPLDASVHSRVHMHDSVSGCRGYIIVEKCCDTAAHHRPAACVRACARHVCVPARAGASASVEPVLWDT